MSEQQPETLQRVKQLAHEASQQARPYDWFETLYTEAAGNTDQIPWAKLTPHPYLLDWLSGQSVIQNAKTALVIGCGLGDDAEALSKLGLAVTAFDVSETAITWCIQRFPGSKVSYQVGDLFNLNPQWNSAFDLVFECRTLQALPLEIRSQAISKIGPLVAPRGCLLVITRLREEFTTSDGPPWPLSNQELSQFATFGLEEISRQSWQEAEIQSVRVAYRRL